jgi:hypothetical protein
MSTFRPVLWALFAAAALTSAACNAKPSEGDCRQAVGNMRRLLATDKINVAGDVESAVRRCRGSSNKKSVKCAIGAGSIAELEACGLLPPPKPGEPAVPEAPLEPPSQAPAGKPEQMPSPAPAPTPAPPAAEPAAAPDPAAPAPAAEPATK